MKLYDSALSPYSSRIRLQLYLKGINAEIVPMATGASKTAAYAKINPLEKVPAIDDKGYCLPESSVIGEYIEDVYPEPSLRPSDAKERARMRVMYNISDSYILNPLFELFDQVNPATRDAAKVDEHLTDLSKGLKGLEHYISGGKYALGASPSLADCCLVPSLFFVGAIAPAFGQGTLLSSTPKVQAYWAAVQTDPHVAKVIGESASALAEYMKQQG